MIRIEATISCPRERAWRFWTDPGHIVHWYSASADWHAPSAENDPRPNGRFKIRMAAKDGSTSFDFEGTYTKVTDGEFLEFVLDDGRKVTVRFSGDEGTTKIVETFDPESLNPEEMQRTGWQAILDSFKRYAEANGSS